MSNFSPARAASLRGPEWLQRRRREAADRFADGGMALPTDAEEVWRYSRIADVDLDRYEPATPVAGAGVAEPDVVRRMCELAGDAAAVVIVVDGTVVRADVNDTAITVGEPTQETTLGVAAGSPTDAFTMLNLGFTSSPIHVDIPKNHTAGGPVLVFHHTSAGELATFPRLIVTVGENAEATVLEHHSSDDSANSLTVPVTELALDKAARLHHLTVQSLDTTTHQIAHTASTLQRDATLRSMAVALGGDYARQRTDTRLQGQGATSELLAVYFGEQHQMHDFRTLQAHEAPSTNSELLFKGAAEDQARGVYSGLIRIEKDAQKSNANQTNRNLVLSEGAHADSIPILEIEANEVRCNHATAVGPIDDEQRYYVESRGIPPHVAERLIVLGFFGEVLARIPRQLHALEPHLRAQVAGKLQRRTA